MVGRLLVPGRVLRDLGAVVTGVDADLATWRQATEQGERAMDELVWTVLNVNWRASANRVEAELSRLTKDAEHWAHECLAAEQQVSRLTQERDEAKWLAAERLTAWKVEVGGWQEAVEAAERALADALDAENEANLKLADTREALENALDVATGFSRKLNMAEKLSYIERILTAGLSAAPEVTGCCQYHRPLFVNGCRDCEAATPETQPAAQAHRGSCRIHYAEETCTCGAAQEPS